MVLGYFEWSLDTRGFWKLHFFWFLVDFGFFDFLGFLVGRKILAGGYGAVLVGVSIPPTQPCKDGTRRSIFYDFENFQFLSKI